MLCLHMATIRITVNLKTNNSQNCQKMGLYGSPTTRDLKKPYSSRWVGGVEGQRDMVWHRGGVVSVAEAEWAVPYSFVVDRNWEGYLGK